MSEKSVDVLAVFTECATRKVPFGDLALAAEKFDEALDAVAELMALLRAIVETDRLVGREDIANLFWPEFIKDARAALARVQGGAP